MLPSAMQCRAVLLLAMLAASAQGQGLYSKVASCVAEEVKKEIVKAAASAVGISQSGSTILPQNRVGEYYVVGFSPGMGCMLMSVISSNPVAMNGTILPTAYTPGAIIAVSSQASRVTANTFTCKFGSNSAAYTPDQARNLAQFGYWAPQASLLNNSATVYQLPAKLTSLKDKVRCTYVLYGKTGFNYTGGRSCQPEKDDPTLPEKCTDVSPFDVPSIQWHFDKDNKPAASQFQPNMMSITCKVNNALLDRKDTALWEISPNDGACFPGWARVITPAGPKAMSQVAVGDRVLAIDAATGKAVYDEVYLVPHRDPDATTTYINIHASAVDGEGVSKVLTVSPTHYVPTACDTGVSGQQQCLKYAREVVVGDLVWLLQGEQAVLARVLEVTTSTEQGMYSPWTVSGSIVVEGFAASTHTAWPYEPELLKLLPRKHVTKAQHLLARAHHVVQALPRAAYFALGKGPFAMLDNVIHGTLEAVKGRGGVWAAAVRASASAAGKIA